MAAGGGDGNASGGQLVLYGLLFLLVGGSGLVWSIEGRYFRRRPARVGNAVASGAIALAGVAMVVVGLVQTL